MIFGTAGLCHNADLPAGAGTKFSRIVARLNPKLLYILQTRLQSEGRRNLTIQVARIGIDDCRPLNAVITNYVLFRCATIEANISIRTRTTVD